MLAFFLPGGWLLALLGIATAAFIIWELLRFASPGVGRWMAAHFRLMLKSRERVHPTGTTYLLVASLAVFLIFDKYVAITSLLFLSVGDFMAAVIGQRFGRRRVFGKSLAGSLACLLACLIIGMAFTRAGNGITVPVAVTGAVVATVIEFLPIPLDDNLTIPLFSAGAMALAAVF